MHSPISVMWHLVNGVVRWYSMAGIFPEWGGSSIRESRWLISGGLSECREYSEAARDMS